MEKVLLISLLLIGVISFYAKPLSIAVAKLINNTGNAKIIE